MKQFPMGPESPIRAFSFFFVIYGYIAGIVVTGKSSPLSLLHYLRLIIFALFVTGEKWIAGVME
jgi:hypothetical protein